MTETIQKENLDTMAKLFDHSVAKYKDQPCLGSRKIIGTRKHFNENGKVLTKFLLEDTYHFNTYNDVSIRVTNVAKGLRYRSRAYPVTVTGFQNRVVTDIVIKNPVVMPTLEYLIKVPWTFIIFWDFFCPRRP